MTLIYGTPPHAGNMPVKRFGHAERLRGQFFLI
jgi:hypothetical protein